MRLTVLGQYAKGLAHHNPLEATALQDRLERIKWRLWHGDADEALTRARALAEDVATLDSGYPGLKRLVKATAGLATYIENNVAAIADYSERWDHGERSRPPLPNPPSTSSSAGALPRSSRCSGRSRAPTGSCRPEPAPSTARCATCSPPGIRPCPPTMVSLYPSLPQPELPSR